MWKENYCLGIELIDQQHRELFEITEKFVSALEQSQPQVETYRDIIAFLKHYVVRHFADEEAYQQSIGYSGLKEHQKLHRNFMSEIFEYEKKLNDSNFAIPVLKDLAGLLTAWLIYHVADADQKIVHADKKSISVGETTALHRFSSAVIDVLEKMAQIDQSQIGQSQLHEIGREAEIFVSIGIVGELKGLVTFGFSKDLALHLVERMTMMQLQEVDEFVCSVLAEIANISSGSASIGISQAGISCDITPPEVSFQTPLETSSTGILLETKLGKIELLLAVKEQFSNQ